MIKSILYYIMKGVYRLWHCIRIWLADKNTPQIQEPAQSCIYSREQDSLLVEIRDNPPCKAGGPKGSVTDLPHNHIDPAINSNRTTFLPLVSSAGLKIALKSRSAIIGNVKKEMGRILEIYWSEAWMNFCYKVLSFSIRFNNNNSLESFNNVRKQS